MPGPMFEHSPIGAWAKEKKSSAVKVALIAKYLKIIGDLVQYHGELTEEEDRAKKEQLALIYGKLSDPPSSHSSPNLVFTSTPAAPKKLRFGKFCRPKRERALSTPTRTLSNCVLATCARFKACNKLTVTDKFLEELSSHTDYVCFEQCLHRMVGNKPSWKRLLVTCYIARLCVLHLSSQKSPTNHISAVRDAIIADSSDSELD
ncbi:hypothetical protein Ciccas_007944 [Cichlidogyrus casuarinus]|uniref:Uncharacterized protein n=1 Tax=Cichlidogyrus casuarinus TaxID=1844966 RepID=A0ABD2Q1E7_9PLAT